LVGFKPGPWSVVIYDALARITGKVSITALNLLLITRFHSLAHWMTWSWPRHIIDVTDLVNANLRLHRWNGLMLCIMMLAHVWSILFPAIFHSYKVEVRHEDLTICRTTHNLGSGCRTTVGHVSPKLSQKFFEKKSN